MQHSLDERSIKGLLLRALLSDMISALMKEGWFSNFVHQNSYSTQTLFEQAHTNTNPSILISEKAGTAGGGSSGAGQGPIAQAWEEEEAQSQEDQRQGGTLIAQRAC